MKTRKRMAAAALCVLAAAGGSLCAQSIAEDMARDMARFRQKQMADMRQFTEERLTDMAQYRDSLNARYADFLEKTWESFSLFRQGRSFAPMPEPPVCDPRDSVPPDDVEVPVIELEPLPPVAPAPVTVDPALPEPTPEPVPVESKKMIAAQFFGTRVQVTAAGGTCGRLSGVSEREVAAYWKSLSAMPVASWMADAQRLGQELKLDDWGNFQLMNTLFKAYLPGGTENERVVFQTFMLNQLGYKAKIGRAQSDLFVLLATSNGLENTPYFIISERSGKVRYYVINPQHRNLSEVQTCAAEYGGDEGCRAMNLAEMSLPDLSSDMETKELRFGNRTYAIDCNRNRINYYATYPCVDFSIYVNAPVDKPTLDCLREELLLQVTGKSQEEAVNFLLHWVQSAFLYKTDSDQFGYEKWNFAEETIVSAYSDCDDRAVLFAQLVRNLLGMKVVLVYYPGVHLATAVHFDNQQATGSYITVGDQKYLICDPTYVGADVGMAMPDLCNSSVEIIRLRDNR